MPFDIYRLTYSLLACLVFFAQPASANEPVELTVGIVPQQSATALAATWIPLLSETARRAGVKLAFRTASDIPTFEERLKNGEYDIAYMNPYHYTVFSKAPGYRAFAREKERKLVGIIVVAKDSPLRELAELNGKAVVFPAPAAFAASILPRAEFDLKNIPIQAKYVNSHDSVYRGVAQGTFAAGGGIKRTLEAIDPAISSRLRILTSTPAYVPHAFAAHPRVDRSMLDKVSAALFTLNGDEAGRQLLEPLSFKGIEAGQDKDWDEIRRLKIDLPIGRPAKP
jgi:phosphonate transport system substrate-binding protein